MAEKRLADDQHPRTLNSFVGAEERLPKWITVSLLVHLAGLLFSCALRRATKPTIRSIPWIWSAAKKLAGPIGHGAKPAAKKRCESRGSAAPIAVPKERNAQGKGRENQSPEKKIADDEVRLRDKAKKEPAKKEPVKESKDEARAETASADSVRERLIQSAVERAKARTEPRRKRLKGKR